jgi:uncharacterized membrane protein YbaN (DUF454 family)
MPMTPSADRPPLAPALLARSRVSRALWMALGWMLVGVGFVGLFVPLLPTTDFLILALPCFARSSVRLEHWLLDHPRVGPPLRAWRAERAIPRHAKIAACGGIALGFASFCALVRPGALPAIAVALLLLACAAWIVSRPSPGADPRIPAAD